MILHQCNHAGCRELIPKSERYCVKHFKSRPKKQSWTYQYRKAIYGKYHKFYNSKRWTKTSRSYRLANPLCVSCKAQGLYVLAQVVDHIIPIRTDVGWEKRWDNDNYQSLCRSCHNIKTFEDEEKYHFKTVSESNYK